MIEWIMKLKTQRGIPISATKKRNASLEFATGHLECGSLREEPFRQSTQTRVSLVMDLPSLCLCGASDSDEMIFCESCFIWFHYPCADLSKDQFQALADSSSIPWYCNCCLQSQSQPTVETNHLQLIRHRCPAVNCDKSYKFRKRLETHITNCHPDIELPALSTPESSEVSMSELISILGSRKKSTKILKRIPKGARPLAATKLAEILDKCVNENNLNSWSSLLLFPSRAFRVPASKEKTSLSSRVKANINSQSLPEALPKPSLKSKTSLSRRVESKLSEGDVSGAVRLLSSDDSLAPCDPSTLRLLELKHPSPSREMTWPEPPPEDLHSHQFAEKDVSSAINSFQLGSAGGIDSLRPQHLRDLTSAKCAASAKLLRALTNFCNFAFAGRINNQVTEIFYGANLCALKKKDGGIRPIAVGLALRRLLAKLACSLVKENMGNLLRPHQLGFGTKGGCEAAVHATRSFLNNNKTSNKVILKVDMKNAFNSVERDSILHAVASNCPDLLPFMWQSYRNDSLLFYGPHLIPSKVGAQQGDPTGPLIFSLTIHPTIKCLQSEFNIWYLDDGTVGGDPDVLLQDALKIVSSFKKLGLEINPSKCELLFCSEPDQEVIKSFQSIFPGIAVLDEHSFTLLGAPLSAAAATIKLQEKFEDLERLTNRLQDLNHHSAYFLLKNCLFIPKLNYLLRSSPTWQTNEFLKKMDSLAFSALSSICNLKLTDSQILQASLPLKLGGLGIRKLQDLSISAFLASISSTFDLISSILNLPEADLSLVHGSDDAFNAWSSLNGSNFPVNTLFQSHWDAINSKRIFDFLTPTDDFTKARFEALTKPESSAWLSVLPSRSVGTILDNNTFRISTALRLGSQMCHPHTCPCGEKVDELGLHGLSCKQSKGRHSRHAELNDIIKRSLSSAQFPTILEPVGLHRDDGKRPDGMTLTPWARGLPLVWDATCTDTFAPSNLPHTSLTAGSAAENAAARKLNKYKEIIVQNYNFVPLAVETMGPWCTAAKLLIQTIGNLLKISSGEPRSTTFITQRVSLAIQRGNAASIMGTFQSSSAMEELFYIL